MAAVVRYMLVWAMCPLSLAHPDGRIRRMSGAGSAPGPAIVIELVGAYMSWLELEAS